MTPEQQRALQVAQKIRFKRVLDSDDWRAQDYAIAAALLEARADGFDEGQGISPQSARDEARRLRAEAQQLREGKNG